MSFDSYEDSVVDSVHNPTGYYTETDEFGNDTGSGYSSPDSGGLYQNHTPSPAWSPAWPTGVNPAFHNEPFIQQQASKGWSRQNLNAMGEAIFQNRAKTQNLAPHEQSMQNPLQVTPIANPIPKSQGNLDVAFHHELRKKNPAREWFFDAIGAKDPKPAIDQWKHDKLESGKSFFTEGAKNWEADNKVVNQPTPTGTLPNNPNLVHANLDKYNSLVKGGLVPGSDGNTGPVGPDGTSFSPGRWSPYEELAAKGPSEIQASSGAYPSNLVGLLNTDFTKGIDTSQMTAKRNNGTMTDAIDFWGKSDKEIVEMINSIGYESTIHPVGFEEYDRDPLVPSSYKPKYSDKDAALINRFRREGKTSDTPAPMYTGGSNKMGNPDPYTGIASKPTIDHEVSSWTKGEEAKVGLSMISPEQEKQFEMLAMSVGPAGVVNAAKTIFGKAWDAYGKPYVSQFLSNYFKGTGKTGLDKLANQPFKRDNYPTVQLDPLVTRRTRNPLGKDQTYQEALKSKGAPFNRNITKADQTPNYLSDKAFRKARIDKGEVKTSIPNPNFSQRNSAMIEMNAKATAQKAEMSYNKTYNEAEKAMSAYGVPRESIKEAVEQYLATKGITKPGK